MPKLSVVLISKNQAWNIGRLIESVLDGTKAIADKEVMLVDSASTDKTVEIASQYPIRVLRLHADQHLGPSAGRYMGYHNTSGTYILFLDGDNELYPGWFEKGYAVLNENPDVAVVTGQRVLMPMDGTEADKPALVDVSVSQIQTIMRSGGSAMYRRSILEEVGTFNPYLFSDEEPDLAVRIRHAGYRITKLDHPIAFDYTDPIDEIPTKIARWRRNLYLGAGQNLRYHWGTETFWMYLKERGFGLLPLFGLMLGLVALIWAIIIGQFLWFGLWTAGLGLMLLADIIRKRSLYLMAVSLVQRLLIVDGTVRGFIRKPLDPAGYPGRHEMVK